MFRIFVKLPVNFLFLLKDEKYGDDSGKFVICKLFLKLGLLLIGNLKHFFSGTRCFGSKGKAQTNFDKYLAGLGQVLAQ